MSGVKKAIILAGGSGNKVKASNYNFIKTIATSL